MSIELKTFNSSFITEEYVNWLNNSELMKFSENRYKKHDLKSCREYYKTFNNSPNLLYAIIDSDFNEHVGNINAYIDIHNGIADIGILVGKTKKGYGYLAWIRMSGNIPMLKIFEKSGMVYEYTKKNQFIFCSELMDEVGYCIFKENYL